MTSFEKGGFLLVNKPKGLSSYDVIRAIKKVADFKRIGHAGTLDPMATGLLILLFNQGTKLFPIINSYSKVYRAKIRLGVVTDTDDLTGRILATNPVKEYKAEEILRVLERYKGEIDQIPPAFSALKERGIPQYRRARRGERVSLRRRKVTVFSIELLALGKESLEIRTEVSKGTYLRALARDIGKDLGCGGTLAELEREKIGRFSLADAVPLPITSEAVIRENWLPIASALYPLPEVVLAKEEIRRLISEKKVPFHSGEMKDYVKVFSEKRDTLILAKRDGDLLKPVRILMANESDK